MPLASFVDSLLPWHSATQALPSAIAFVRKSKGDFHIFCSGVPLSSQLVLTAAHCLPPTQRNGGAGQGALTVLKREENPKSVAVLRWMTHPGFKLVPQVQSEDFDIAVVETEPETRPETTTRTSQNLLCLSENSICRGLWILGFSPRRLGLENPQDAIRSPSAWSNIILHQQIPREGKFLARTSAKVSPAACPGDSGAPVWQIDSKQAQLVGLVVQANCEKGDVKVVDVNRYASWIISAARTLSEAPTLSMAQ